MRRASSVRALRAILAGAIATALFAAASFLVMRAVGRLRPRDDGVVVYSVWRDGKTTVRAVGREKQARPREIETARAASGSRVGMERIVADAYVPRTPVLLAVSLVPGRDGVEASLDGATAYVTPDDLLAAGAYDRAFVAPSIALEIGTDTAVVFALLAERLGKDAAEVRTRASLRRIRVARAMADEAPVRVVTSESLDARTARAAALDGARYLARHVGEDGLFDYAVDARTGERLPGYDFTRHAGATLFLAATARVTGEPGLRQATSRAVTALRAGLVSCGEGKCFPEGGTAGVGVASLTLLAFVEVLLEGRNADVIVGLRDDIAGLARFLRAQRRPDGDLWHRYDLATSTVVPIELPYFSGEAALALARAALVVDARENLDAAAGVLAHITRPGGFGSRYLVGEEHWTCQAMEALHASRPDARALAFCLAWSASTRKMELHAEDGELDLDGAIGFAPFPTPRPAVLGGRMEGVLSTLAVARASGAAQEEIAALEAQTRRAMAFLVRSQLRPGPRHLFADPAAMLGGVPTSAVDFEVRIDAVQHAAYALLRWSSLETTRTTVRP